MQSFIVFIVSFGFVAPAIGAALTGPIVNPDNGHSYYLLDTSDWTDAQSTAVTMGGNLATIRNAAENSWILSTFGDYGGVDRFLWIGFFDPSQDQDGGSHAANFEWVNGEPITYTNWSGSEPDDLNDAEYWTEMYPANVARGPGYGTVAPGTWNDVPNSSYPYEDNPSGNNFGPVYGVVEVIPEPASVSLLAIGSFGLLHRSRRRMQNVFGECH